MKLVAEFCMIQGHVTTPRMAQMYCPRRTLMYEGRRIARSLPTAVELEEMLVAMTARAQQTAEKNWAARDDQRAET